MLTKPGEELGWFVARKVWDGKASGVLFVKDVSQCDAEEANAEPGEEREVVDGVLSDVRLVNACRELKDRRVFCCKK